MHHSHKLCRFSSHVKRALLIKAKGWRGIQNSVDGWLNRLQAGPMYVSNLIDYLSFLSFLLWSMVLSSSNWLLNIQKAVILSSELFLSSILHPWIHKRKRKDRGANNNSYHHIKQTNYASDLLRVERNMVLRRRRLLSVLNKDEIAPTVTCFPLLGVGDFIDDPLPFNSDDSKSIYLPDYIINPHPRYSTSIFKLNMMSLHLLLSLYRHYFYYLQC